MRDKMGIQEAFICDPQAGDDLFSEISNKITDCDLAVIMGTLTYGKHTSSICSTYREMKHIMHERKPVVVLKMCDR